MINTFLSFLYIEKSHRLLSNNIIDNFEFLRNYFIEFIIPFFSIKKMS